GARACEDEMSEEAKYIYTYILEDETFGAIDAALWEWCSAVVPMSSRRTPRSSASARYALSHGGTEFAIISIRQLDLQRVLIRIEIARTSRTPDYNPAARLLALFLEWHAQDRLQQSDHLPDVADSDLHAWTRSIVPPRPTGPQPPQHGD